MPKYINYKNRVEWRGEHRGFTWMDNGAAQIFSAPEPLYGVRDVLTPEDALMAGANTCIHMMVIWVMERFNIDLVSYECDAEGVVEEFIDLTSKFVKITMKPNLVVKGTSKEKVMRALAQARKYSTICESLNCEVIIEPTVTVQ